MNSLHFDTDELDLLVHDIDESDYSEWSQIRDDSALIYLIDSQDLEEMESLTDSISCMSIVTSSCE